MREHFIVTWRLGGPNGEPGCPLDVFVEDNVFRFTPQGTIGTGGTELLQAYASRGLLPNGRGSLRIGASRNEIKQAVQAAITEVLHAPCHLDSLGSYADREAAEQVSH